MKTLLPLLPASMVGVNLLLLPNLERRLRLFGVQITPEYFASPDAQRAINGYRGFVIISMLATIAWTFLRPEDLALAFIALFAGTAFGYYRAHGLVAPFRATPVAAPSLEVAAAPDTPPRALWLSAGPFVILALTALALYLCWDSLPSKFPVHWGIDGEADRWAVKGFKSVFGLLICAAEFCAWCVICSIASWYGARRSTPRKSILQVWVAVEYLLGILFSFLALTPILVLPAWLRTVLVFVPLPFLLLFLAKVAAEPSDPPEKTPDECWKFGGIYYNPDDMALVVEKRGGGFGLTFNFANPRSWPLVGTLLLVFATLPLLLP